MSGALGYLAATNQSQSQAGLTGVPVEGEAMARFTPPAAQGIGQTAFQGATGLTANDVLFGGGTHPELLAATDIPRNVATDTVKATDSVAGRLGGLVPRLGSTVAPGPEGGAARARSTLGKGIARAKEGLVPFAKLTAPSGEASNSADPALSTAPNNGQSS